MDASADPPVAGLAAGLAAGDRRTLARAITLVESTRPDHRMAARALIAALPPPPRPTLRIGLTGTPGVGKSTFIEAFGMHLVGLGHRVAVLAVDPSSPRTGGAILGDKTRMGTLARHRHAFIRPSPSQAALGGIGPRTRDAVTLAEAAGFDLVLVETVGVGQSETEVAGITDLFLLLLAPGGGDELQGVKRGIMERADLILVNKADGTLVAEADRTRAEYAGALRLIRPRDGDPDGVPEVRCVSARTGAGLAEAWSALARLAAHRRDTGAFARTRDAQAEAALDAALAQALAARVRADPALSAAWPALQADVRAGRLSPEAAAEAALARLRP